MFERKFFSKREIKLSLWPLILLFVLFIGILLFVVKLWKSMLLR